MEKFENMVKQIPAIEKIINQYITLKLESGKTFIYVNGKKFIQCIRLILNLPNEDIHLYDEFESIDEATKFYKTYLFQNKFKKPSEIDPVLSQGIRITPEEEFWGHCSNIQAWVEHDYDTTVLMSDLSFPLLRELTNIGDPVAKRIYKEEIVRRLESGYPSVVQYLIIQRYLNVFSPNELRNILDSPETIDIFYSDRKILSYLTYFCVYFFPELIEEILSQILKLPNGKNIFISLIQSKAGTPSSKSRLILNSRKFLFTLKSAMESLYLRAVEKDNETILEYVQAIDNQIREQGLPLSKISKLNDLEAIKNRLISNIPYDELNEEQKKLLKHKFLVGTRKRRARCSYCGKKIRDDQDICDWCGHRKAGDV